MKRKTAIDHRRRRGRNAMWTLLCLFYCQGPNSLLSLCYALWPLSNLGFSLSHTHPIKAIMVLMIPFFCLALDAFIF